MRGISRWQRARTQAWAAATSLAVARAVAAPPPAKVATSARAGVASSVTRTPIAGICPSSASHKAAARVRRASASCAHRCVTTRNVNWCAAATTSRIGIRAFASNTEFRRRRPALAMWVPRTVTTIASVSGARPVRAYCLRIRRAVAFRGSARVGSYRAIARTVATPIIGNRARLRARWAAQAARVARGQWARACRPAKRFDRGIRP